MAPVTEPRPPARERIVAAGLAVFAEYGFRGARLQEVAERAGIRHPTLLYHFESKEGLYAAVIEAATADWAAETAKAISTGLRGFPQVAALIEAAFHFFAEHGDFVSIVRREAIEGGHRLEDAMADFLRPFLADAVRFLEREVTEGRLRPHDPLELMQICYGSVLTYFSDARFRARLVDEDPLGAAARERHCGALIETLRSALEPGG